MLWRNFNKWRIHNEKKFCVLNDNYIYPLTIIKRNSNLSTCIQCWKFPQVRRSEAVNFGGGLGTFCWFFFNFMFMIWDSRHEDLQLFWLSFKPCIHSQFMYKSHKIQHGKIITAVVNGSWMYCRIPGVESERSSNADVGVEMIIGLCLATIQCLSLPDHL